MLPSSWILPFHVYLDEFHNFMTRSFATFLSEGLKYKISLTLAHQCLAQMHPEVRDAVIGNVGTSIVFRLGEDDARQLAKRVEQAPEQLIDLSTGSAAVKILEGGHPRTYRCTVPLPSFVRYGKSEKIERYTRSRFARTRKDVKQQVRGWHRQFRPALGS